VIFVPSRKTRLVVARLERGEDLHASIAELARWESVDAGLVRGSGLVEEIVLHDWRGRLRQQTLVHHGVVELAALTGSVALRDGTPEVRLHAVVGVGREGDRVVDTVGLGSAGFVAQARALSVELAIDVLDDVHLDLRIDEATGLPAWHPSPRR
jgi:predicted DNA-binding protein with PD1-like motif